MRNELLFKEIEKLPGHFKKELLDYILSLKDKAARGKVCASLMGESLLQQGQLKPEEEAEAWNASRIL